MNRLWRRRLFGFALLIAIVGAVGWLAYRPRAARRGGVPGTYTSSSLVDKGMAVYRFAPDGSFSEEVYPPGAAQPSFTNSGRWRLSGNVLFWETGAAAAAPVGFFQPLRERFESPILMPEVSKFRLVSADETGLVLEISGVSVVLNRKAEEP